MKCQLGPIVGHVEPTRARIWIQTDEPGLVRLRVFHDPNSRREIGIGFEA